MKNCKTCGKKVSHNNKSGFCKECKAPAKTKAEVVSEWRRRRKQLLVENKGGKCEICGYDKYIGNLVFHHLDPSVKDFGLSAKGATRSLEKSLKEIEKCILVCHNCHGEIHGGIINIPR